MNFKKELCINCYNEKLFGNYCNWSKADDKRLERGYVYCPNFDKHIFKIGGEEHKKSCPYYLEHVV